MMIRDNRTSKTVPLFKLQQGECFQNPENECFYMVLENFGSDVIIDKVMAVCLETGNVSSFDVSMFVCPVMAELNIIKNVDC